MPARGAAKHARASAADIQVAESDSLLHVRIRDNGRGGATFSDGSGLLGLKDRAEALGGHLRLDSPPGAGTTLDITLPLHDPRTAGLPPDANGPLSSTRLTISAAGSGKGFVRCDMAWAHHG